MDKREELTNKEVFLLASRMLEIASDKFANNSANDLDTHTISLIKNKDALCQSIQVWNTGSEDVVFSSKEWPQGVNHIGDSSLMSFLSDKLKEISNSILPSEITICKPNGAKVKVSTFAYITAKTNNLIEFGYNDLKEDVVADQLKKVLNDSELNVIGHFIKDDIVKSD